MGLGDWGKSLRGPRCPLFPMVPDVTAEALTQDRRQAPTRKDICSLGQRTRERASYQQKTLTVAAPVKHQWGPPPPVAPNCPLRGSRWWPIAHHIVLLDKWGPILYPHPEEAECGAPIPSIVMVGDGGVLSGLSNRDLGSGSSWSHPVAPLPTVVSVSPGHLSSHLAPKQIGQHSGPVHSHRHQGSRA